MKQRISDLLDVLEDDSVPIREKEIVAPGRILEATMTKIRAEETDARAAGTKLSKGTIAVILAAAFLILSITASASGMFGRIVSWKGRSVPVDPELSRPFETVQPDTVMIGNESLDETIASLLAGQKEDELLIVRHGRSASSQDRTVSLSSAEELEARLEEEESLLTIPIAIPEDYHFVSGRVSLESRLGCGYSLSSAETRPDGLTVERYTVSPEGDFISGYMLQYENKTGKKILILASMMPDAQAGFGVPEGGAVYSLDVPGTESALGIVNADGTRTSLYLQQKLSPPVVCESRDALMGGPEGSMEYTDIQYNITCDGWSTEDAAALLVFR